MCDFKPVSVAQDSSIPQMMIYSFPHSHHVINHNLLFQCFFPSTGYHHKINTSLSKLVKSYKGEILRTCINSHPICSNIFPISKQASCVVVEMQFAYAVFLHRELNIEILHVSIQTLEVITDFVDRLCSDLVLDLSQVYLKQKACLSFDFDLGCIILMPLSDSSKEQY